ncbi:sodium:solute symporter, partial [Chloroflexota bacterium]
MLELIIIAVYFLAVIAVGVISRRRARGADDFFVAGRRGSSLLITGSLLATIVGGSAIMVTSKLGFTQGLTGIWWLLVGSIGLAVMGIFLAKKVREFGLYTLPEMVERQYDGRVALASSILIVIAWIGVIGAQVIAAGSIMGILGIGSPQLWMVIFTGVFVVYTVLGGQHAILRTDTLQTIIIFAGIFGGLALLMPHLGGISGLMNSLPSEQFAFPLSPGFDGYALTSLLLLVGLTYVVGPDMYSRLFCAKDSKVARTSAIWTALLIIPVAIGITLIGMGASALFPDISPGQALPMVIKEVFPPFLGGIVLAALLCAFMSSADTTLLTASTILTVDIVGKIKPSLSQGKMLALSRCGIVILGVVSLILALYMGDIVSTILFAYTVYTGGLIMPVLAGFYKNRLKVTPMGALVSIVGGGSLALVSKLFGIKYLDLGSLLFSLLLLFVVSLIDNKIRTGK